MEIKSFMLLSLIFCLVHYGLSFSVENINVEDEVVTYVGAVIEYEPYDDWVEEEKGYGVIRKNVEDVSATAKMAKVQQADILVAPEYGLTSLTVHSENFTRFFTYSTYVPNPSDSVVLCNSSQNDPNIEGLKLLSCTAKEESMYLVVNMIEAHPCSEETIASAPWSTYEPDENCTETGFFFHNAEIVIDRTGAVIARYRKIHLFNEDYLIPGPVDDTTAIFVTDFGVTFTLQICFDILFEDPGYNNVINNGITDVVQSTAWVDYLPFNSADLTQDGWSRGLKVNLIISGYHLPEESKMGSGIYRQLFDESPVYVYDKDSGNVLLVAEVKTTVKSTFSSKSTNSQRKRREKIQDQIIYLNTEKEEDRVHVVFHESLQDYASVNLESGAESEVLTADVCSIDNFCCNLTYQYTGNLTYMLMALKGQFFVANRYPIGVQNCAVLWCKSDNINTCGTVDRTGINDVFGPFNLSSSSYTIDSVFPDGAHRNLKLVDHGILQHAVEGELYSLSANQPISDFFGASLFGRWYSNDT